MNIKNNGKYCKINKPKIILFYVDGVLNIKPNEIIFFDDIQNNIDMASSYGINSFLFTDMKKFNQDLDSFNLN